MLYSLLCILFTIPGRQVCPGGERLPIFTNSRTKITNQRRNSVWITSSRTKLGEPKSDSTMAMLAAYSILLTHICSALYLLPRDQFWRSNAFSPCRELPFAGRQKSDFSSTGCWHIHNQINTTTKQRHVPKKHIRKKPILSIFTIKKGGDGKELSPCWSGSA
jgi:hypothetical protein